VLYRINAPRIPDLKNRRLYIFGKPSAYPTLEPLIAGRINLALIRAHWPEIRRVAASILPAIAPSRSAPRGISARQGRAGVW
jgi:TnpA family transposase